MRFCSQCASAFPDSFRVCPKDGSALEARGHLEPGTAIRGKYLILEKLGSGGMATVYKARHIRFEEVCAVKVISEQCLAEPALVERFHREAAIARKLRHESAVAIQDVDETEDGRPFIAMEYIAGRNLRAVLTTEGPLPPARAVNVATQIAAALSAAHAMGIVHRDIKPDNVMLCGDDRVKVLDFGIARLQAEARTTLTRTGLVMGTPDYMSPEQAMGIPSERIDGRSDIYSLGIVIYELLTGRLPFESDTPTGMLLQHIQAVPQAPHLKCPDLRLPAALSEVLLIALAKEPAARFQNAQALVVALRGAIGEGVATAARQPKSAATETAPGYRPTVLGAQPAPQAPATQAAAPARATIASQPTLVLVVVFLIAMAGVGYYRLRPSPEPLNNADPRPTQSVAPVPTQPATDPTPTPTATPPASGNTAQGDPGKDPAEGGSERASPTSQPVIYQPAGPAASHAETIYEVGGDVSAPKLLSAPRPQYTEAARINQVQGEVRLIVIVKADGTLGSITKVEQGLPDGLTEQAIAAAKQWRFDPAMRFGQPVPVFQRLHIGFRLY